MRKTLLLLILFCIAVPSVAHATRCWVTLAKIGSGDLTKNDGHRPALGEMKPKYKALVVGWEGKTEELVLVVIDSADLPSLKKVAARYHGAETITKTGKNKGKRTVSAALKKKLVTEAMRLGSDSHWDPEKRNVAGD